MNSILSVKIFQNNNFIKRLVFKESGDEVKYEDIKIKNYMGIIKIGRMSSAHINIESTSRMHATIEYQNGDFVFNAIDRKKSFINGVEVKSEIILKEGDEIQIDEITIIVYPHIIVDEDKNSNKEDNILDLISEISLDNEVIEDLDFIELDSEKLNTLENSKNIYFSVTEDDPRDNREVVARAIEIKHYWNGNMISSKLFKSKENITIGKLQEDSFYINPEYINNKSFTILENGNNINFLLENVHYIEGTDEYNLEELKEVDKIVIKDNYGTIKLRYGAKLAFEIKENRFEINNVAIYKAVSKNSSKVFIDGLNLKFSILSLILHAVIVFLISLSPQEIESFNLEKLNNIPVRYASVILNPDKVKEKREVIEFVDKGKKEMSKFNKNNTDSVVFVKGEKHDNLTRRKMKIRNLVKRQGMLIAFTKGGGLGNNSGDFLGHNDDDIRLVDNSDSLIVATSGNPNIRGGATGAGGGGNKTLGTGGPSTSNSGTRYSSRRYKTNRRDKKRRKLTIDFKEPSLSGNLTKRQIEKVVKRNISQMRYCYEKELLRKPKLKGVITVSWTISPQGRVISVKILGATLNDNSVHSCMRKTIKRWKFPEPRGGGYAKVKYPFSFRSS